MDDVYKQPSPAVTEPEREARKCWRQARREGKTAVVVAHPAEPSDRGDPRAGQRGYVKAVTCVVFEIVQVHQRRLGEVVIGQLEVANFGRDDRLDARGQRGVADDQRFVVRKIAGLLHRCERIAARGTAPARGPAA